MHIRDFAGKNVCILGFGREGEAMWNALREHAPTAEITIADERTDISAPDGEAQMQLGTGWLQNLEKFDVIVRSPGVFESTLKAVPQHVRNKFTNATQTFLDSVEGTGATVIGVTGSKGKSTTSSLIAAVLKSAGKDVHLVGNIGIPAISLLKSVNTNTFFVHEMSSYQLLHCTKSPHIAVITAFFPEHLDYHGSLESYFEAKANIVRFQKKNNIVIFNSKQPEVSRMANVSKGKHIPFNIDDCPLQPSKLQLIGEHNRSNIAAVYLLAKELKLPEATTLEAIRTFRGLPHRLEDLGVHHGIRWINDSISTTPESTIAALAALPDTTTLILGGQDRGYDFTGLAATIAKNPKIHDVILFPGSGKRIEEALLQKKAKVAVHHVTSMEEAVSISKSITKPGGLCLLSPASPSYGIFKNFEERGGLFQKYVIQI